MVDRAKTTSGRLTGIHVPGVQSLTFTYDAADRITAITNGRQAALTQAFTYDKLSRLTQVASSSGNESYAYDANGNRTTRVIGGVTTHSAIQTSSNRLASVGGQAIGYDANGNTVSMGGETYHYDPFNRLQSAGGTTYYVNPEGQRLRKSGPLGTTKFALDRSGLLLAEYSAASGWVDYVYLGGRLIGRIADNQVYAVATDQVGRPEAVTNASKAIVWQAQNKAFDRSVSTEDITLNLGFPGQYHDAETGLWHNGFRDYDAKLGRYIESDPIGLRGGVNTFVYTRNDPVVRVDPYGLDDTICMFNPSMCGMHPSAVVRNASVGLGAAGNLLAGYGSVEVGVDVDSKGAMCVHVQLCEGIVAGLPVQGEAGVTGSVGTGKLCSGTQVTKGVFILGGEGVAGGGQVTANKSGLSVSRGIFGVGGSPEGPAGGAGGAGALVCTTKYWCTK